MFCLSFRFEFVAYQKMGAGTIVGLYGGDAVLADRVSQSDCSFDFLKKSQAPAGGAVKEAPVAPRYSIDAGRSGGFGRYVEAASY